MHFWDAKFRVAHHLMQDEVEEDKFVAGLILGLEANNGNSGPRKITRGI